MNSPTESWQRIKLDGLNRLVNAPPPLRWRWEMPAQPGDRSVRLVTPRGVRWQFRLRRGAWVRRVPAPPPGAS